MGIGQKIRTLREHRCWKQGRLAERAGISQTHLSQIEREQIETPHLSTIKPLLEALDVNTEQLFKNLLRGVEMDMFLTACGEQPEPSMMSADSDGSSI